MRQTLICASRVFQDEGGSLEPTAVAQAFDASDSFAAKLSIRKALRIRVINCAKIKPFSQREGPCLHRQDQDQKLPLQHQRAPGPCPCGQALAQ